MYFIYTGILLPRGTLYYTATCLPFNVYYDSENYLFYSEVSALLVCSFNVVSIPCVCYSVGRTVSYCVESWQISTKSITTTGISVK